MTDLTQIRIFLTGSRAKFTLVSKVTGVRYTYRFSRGKDPLKTWVSVLVGTDNQSDYVKIGCVYRIDRLAQRPGTHPKAGFWWAPERKDAPSTAGIRWFLEHLRDSLTVDWFQRIEFWHAGVCSRCGRELTDPESIARGLGPICAEAAP
jgi:hypothetical protein